MENSLQNVIKQKSFYSFYFDLKNTYEDIREKESLWLCQTVLLLLKII